MFQRDDLVKYTQMEMFDKTLEGRQGLFKESFIKPFEFGEEIYAVVLFFGIGFRDVPIVCLSGVKKITF